jgi:hypothetical protein
VERWAQEAVEKKVQEPAEKKVQEPAEKKGQEPAEKKVHKEETRKVWEQDRREVEVKARKWHARENLRSWSPVGRGLRSGWGIQHAIAVLLTCHDALMELATSTPSSP